MTNWSKEKLGDNVKKIIIREEIVRLKEDFIKEDPSRENRINDIIEGLG